MSDPIKQFIRTLDKTDAAEHLLEETELADNTLETLKSAGEAILEWIKPSEEAKIKQDALTPDYKESVIEPKKSTTLYEITNSKDKLPEVSKNSTLFSSLKYHFKGFGAAATIKKGDNAYSLIGGEKFGLDYSKKEGSVRKNFQATFNVINNKSELKYTEKSKQYSFRGSIYNKDGINGVTVSYQDNPSGIISAFSADQNSVSLKLGVEKETPRHTVEINAFITAGKKYEPVFGVSGRITLN